MSYKGKTGMSVGKATHVEYSLANSEKNGEIFSFLRGNICDDSRLGKESDEFFCTVMH